MIAAGVETLRRLFLPFVASCDKNSAMKRHNIAVLPGDGTGARSGLEVMIGANLTLGGMLELIFDAPASESFSFNMDDLFFGEGEVSGAFESVHFGGVYDTTLSAENDWTGEVAGKTFSYNPVNGEFDVDMVPEPGAWALMIGGLGVLALLRRRKS